MPGPQTFSRLNALESSDGSTAHFESSEFQSTDGSGFSGGAVGAATMKENVRRTMHKLGAAQEVRHRAVTINTGVRTVPPPVRLRRGGSRIPVAAGPG
ncbi:hypothetical protein ACF09E_14440 [Streptomyces sp. NPDC014891]|uniref:hypothetical protein n=1 Tax=Streptomyces sp. NPDC014891 TaxID=3364929 RepID=UPI00370326F4